MSEFRRCETCNKLEYGAVSRECFDCRQLRTNCDEETHGIMIRCPYCQHLFKACPDDDPGVGLYEEGEHDVACPLCHEPFEVLVSVSYTSPALRELEVQDG